MPLPQNIGEFAQQETERIQSLAPAPQAPELSQPLISEAAEFETPTGEPGHSQVTGIKQTPLGEEIVPLTIAAKVSKMTNESYQEYMSDGQFLKNWEGSDLLAQVKAKKYAIDSDFAGNPIVRFTGLQGVENKPAISKVVLESLVQDFGSKYEALSTVLAELQS